MKRSDDLFRLIKTLSMSEKRYFKMFASLQSGPKNYLRLFDAIDAQEQYDEDAIRAGFEGERFVKQLNVTKKYLYDLILKSLRTSYTEFEVGPQVKDAIKSARILKLRGLDVQALRALDRAARLAESHEVAIPRFEALYWSEAWRPGACDSETAIEEKYDHLFSALDNVRCELEYERITYRALLIFKHHRARTPEEYAHIDACLADPLLTSEEHALTLRARVLRCMALGIFHDGKNNFGEAVRWFDQQIALMEANPLYIEEHIHHYLDALTNRLGSLAHVVDQEEYYRNADIVRAKTRTLLEENGVRSMRIQLKAFCGISMCLLASIAAYGAFEKGKEMLPEIERGLEYFDPIIKDSFRITIYHGIAFVYFGLGEYGRALEYVNMILNSPEPQRNRGITYQARIFQLIIHFELGNLELIPYLIRSAYRYYSTQNRLYKTETCILAFFRMLCRVDTPAQLTEALHNLHEALVPFQDDPNEQVMFNFFNYVAWLESRLQGRTLGEVLQERWTRIETAAA